MATLMALLGIGALLANLGRPDAQEISFQHFKTQLLSRGLVDKVEVTNKTTAKVFVRTGAKYASQFSCHLYYCASRILPMSILLLLLGFMECARLLLSCADVESLLV